VYDLKGTDVRTSVINGKVVMLDGRVLTLDDTRIKQKAREFQKRILLSLKGGRLSKNQNSNPGGSGTARKLESGVIAPE
jgi:hypothetical protein